MKFFKGWILPLLTAFAVAVLAWLAFGDRICVVGSDSMSPTLVRGQKLGLEYGGTIRRNDVVLVSYPSTTQDSIPAPVLKRCVCMPGDTIVRLRRTHLYGPAVLPRKGLKISLDYANYSIYRELAMKYENVRMEWRDGVCTVNGKAAKSYVFGRSYVFLVNDNRGDKADSRTFGPVPMDWVVAKIKYVF